MNTFCIIHLSLSIICGDIANVSKKLSGLRQLRWMTQLHEGRQVELSVIQPHRENKHPVTQVHFRRPLFSAHLPEEKLQVRSMIALLSCYNYNTK